MKSDEQKLLEKWGDRKLIEETVKSMNLHTTPAPETRERLKALEIIQTNLMEKLEENQIQNEKAQEALMTSMKEFHLTTNQSLKDMTDKLDKALEKKAGIWVEKVLYGAGAICGAGILSYIGLQIIKVIEKL